jgi:hypothetical protein
MNLSTVAQSDLIFDLQINDFYLSISDPSSRSNSVWVDSLGVNQPGILEPAAGSYLGS